MNYFGEKVTHKSFGKGVVVSQTETQIDVCRREETGLDSPGIEPVFFGGLSFTVG